MQKLGQLINEAIKTQYPPGTPIPPAAAALKKAEGESMNDRYTLELIRQLKVLGLPDPIREFRFHPDRMWRSDLAYPEKKILIEIDGGSFGRVVVCHQCKSNVLRKLADGRFVPIREGGRHSGGVATEKDNEKRNAALALGFRPFGFAPKHIKDGYAAQLIAQIFRAS